ncbi:f-box domain-containing protein [Gigaspora margarita]|uniref:F-box domain-containing protein n=1 Tax=Gigaspora margarita TaxID=4874 RepID=A0A8H3X7J5_GIGMA|nr:f-box domain-containing protein [Gigaspora margarita]
MKEIPNECIYAILINFAKDNKSLYSCCLVNRSWCLNTLPILWSNPLQREVSKSLIRTYLSTLSPEEKEPLISFGITLPNLPKPLFKYGAFLKIFDISSTKDGVEMWLKQEGFVHYNSVVLALAYDIVMESLITMFLRRSLNLEELVINGQHMFPKVTTFLNVMPGITQLKTLQFKFQRFENSTNTNITELMNALTPEVCPYLNQLNIKSYLPNDVNDALVNIIKSHKNLEKIELDSSDISRSIIVYNITNCANELTVREFFSCGITDKVMLFKNDNNNKQTAYITFNQERAARFALLLTNSTIYDSRITVKSSAGIDYIKIFQTFSYVGNSLKELMLQYTDFSKISPDNLENISKCQNLVRFSCKNCQGMTLKHCTSLSKKKLNLKKLEIIGLSFDQIVMNALISMWGSTLEVLHLNELNQETANALLIHCSNLKELSINNLNAISLKFMYPFLLQSSLKSLLIDAKRQFYKEYVDLFQNLPITLNFLGLYTNFSDLEFELYVKECKTIFLKPLNIKRI